MPMKKKVEPSEIELAVAAHVFVDGFTSVKHHLRTLLQKIKSELRNPSLTTRDIRRALADWLIKGYAVIEEDCLKINRAGRKHVKALAEVATAPALVMA